MDAEYRKSRRKLKPPMVDDYFDRREEDGKDASEEYDKPQGTMTQTSKGFITERL